MLPMRFGMGGFGAPRGLPRNFEHPYFVHSMASADKTDTSSLEGGGKIMLPASALARLAELEIVYPMLFEVANPESGRRIHCGVLEFSAEEGVAYMPHWMMENLGVPVGGRVIVKSVTLPKGRLVKLRPQSKDFLDISNPRAVLEKTLRHFSALTVHTTIRIFYLDRPFDIDIVEVQPDTQGAICILDADVNTEFEAPPDYVDESMVARAANAASKLADPSAPMAADSDDEEDNSGTGFTAFSGAGQRLKENPKKGAATSASSSRAGSTTGASGGKKPALQWRLKFERFGGVQPPITKRDEGGEDGKDSFVAFQGGGNSLKRPKAPGKK